MHELAELMRSQKSKYRGLGLKEEAELSGRVSDVLLKGLKLK